MTDTSRGAGPQPGAGPPSDDRRQLWLSLARMGAVVAALVVVAVVRGWVNQLVIIVGIVVMISLHELGHFLTARWAGMKVTEFFIGFGPRLWAVRRGETTYGIKAIPAGAYVRIIGMHNLEDVDPEEEERTYRSKPYRHRLMVAVAGSAMHFLLALVLLVVLFAAVGTPKADVWRIGELAPLPNRTTSPAEEAGLRPGDRIVAVDGRQVRTFAELAEALRARPGERVTLTVQRGDRVFETAATLDVRVDEVTGETVGYLGVAAEYPPVTEPLPRAVVDSVVSFADLTVASVRGLAEFFSPGNLARYVDRVFSGPAATEVPTDDTGRVISLVGGARLADEATQRGGFGAMLQFFVAINVFVGVFNLVPLLPLDGGHVAIATYERLRSRPGRPYRVDVVKLLPVTYAVVALLAFVFVTSLYLDIVDPLTLSGG